LKTKFKQIYGKQTSSNKIQTKFKWNWKKVQTKLLKTKFIKWNSVQNSSEIENKIQMKLKRNWKKSNGIIENKIHQTKFKWYWKQNSNKIETKLKTKFIKPNSARVWPAHA
jgi:hypothetical protein